MDASSPRNGREFYACPHCGHSDPNAIDYWVGTFWRVAKGTPERCLHCGHEMHRSGRTFLVTYALASPLGLLFYDGSSFLAAFSIHEGTAAFVKLAGYAVGMTVLLFLPRLVYRGFGLRMYAVVAERMHSAVDET